MELEVSIQKVSIPEGWKIYVESEESKKFAEENIKFLRAGIDQQYICNIMISCNNRVTVLPGQDLYSNPIAYIQSVGDQTSWCVLRFKIDQDFDKPQVVNVIAV